MRLAPPPRRSRLMTSPSADHHALAVSPNALRELFFAQSLDGFFIMMLDEPVHWHDGADKAALLDYIFAHQRMSLANDAYARHYAMPLTQIIGMTPRDFYSHDLPRGHAGWRA